MAWSPPDPGGPPSCLVHIYGDSLTAHLQKDLGHIATGNIEYKVFAKPGATIARLSKYLRNKPVQADVSYVILHVGTNSLANCGYLTRFIREYRELIRIVQGKFPFATICISELFVRDSFVVRTYNYELNKLCNLQKVQFIRTSVDYRDLSDGLHLDEIGYRKFANDLDSYLACRERETPKIRVPYCMIPLVQKKTEKKTKKTEKKTKKTKEKTKMHESYGTPIAGQNHTPVRKCSKKPRVYNIFGGDGYSRIGWKQLPPAKDVVLVLPLPGHIPASPCPIPHVPVITPVPYQASAYVQQKKKGKKKKKRKKKIKKRRNRHKNKQLSPATMHELMLSQMTEMNRHATIQPQQRDDNTEEVNILQLLFGDQQETEQHKADEFRFPADGAAIHITQLLG
ncbi:uncharacterized protein [Amphiura filiformis]|uniref:uncharacterized protein n=1 Tax=Amphiura filiformis TaxID=82378 RepID=UPI003B221799